MSNESGSLKPPVTNNSSVEESATHIQKLALAALLSVVIVVVIIGNTLVILAVITTKRLRTVTNCFVMSLAIADWLVGVFVMPPAVAVALMGKQTPVEANRLIQSRIHRYLGTWLGFVRHLGVAGHPPVHRVDLESLCHKR